MTTTLLHLWMDAFDASVSAAETVNARMGRFADAAATGRLLAEPELWRMGPEKVAALQAGMFAASMTAARHWPGAAMDPMKLPAMGLAIAKAASAPARRTVNANARRLKRSKPGK